jgi:hypothetical protein
MLALLNLSVEREATSFDKVSADSGGSGHIGEVTSAVFRESDLEVERVFRRKLPQITKKYSRDTFSLNFSRN